MDGGERGRRYCGILGPLIMPKGIANPAMTVEEIDAILNENKDKRFVQRLYEKNAAHLSNEDGSISTHVMQSGDGRVMPTIVEVDGELRRLSGDEAYAHAMKTGQYIQFDNKTQECSMKKEKFIMNFLK